jgi:hypothetical protein
LRDQIIQARGVHRFQHGGDFGAARADVPRGEIFCSFQRGQLVETAHDNVLRNSS